MEFVWKSNRDECTILSDAVVVEARSVRASVSARFRHELRWADGRTKRSQPKLFAWVGEFEKWFVIFAV